MLKAQRNSNLKKKTKTLQNRLYIYVYVYSSWGVFFIFQWGKAGFVNLGYILTELNCRPPEREKWTWPLNYSYGIAAEMLMNGKNNEPNGTINREISCIHVVELFHNNFIKKRRKKQFQDLSKHILENNQL